MRSEVALLRGGGWKKGGQQTNDNVAGEAPAQGRSRDSALRRRRKRGEVDRIGDWPGLNRFLGARRKRRKAGSKQGVVWDRGNLEIQVQSQSEWVIESESVEEKAWTPKKTERRC